MSCAKRAVPSALRRAVLLGACAASCAANAGARFVVEGPDWVPLAFTNDVIAGSALDFGAVVPHHKPAGKYGWLLPRGESFEFERLPGVPQRFLGVNLCYGANFLDLETARKSMRRISRLGYNAVRIHHHDAALVADPSDLSHLNERAFEGLDNVVAAAIEEGLYLTTDLWVSRQPSYRQIGIDRDGMVPYEDYRLLVEFHPGAFSNYVAFAKSFMLHRNRHTGRTYAEEPALAWISLVNEGNQGLFGTAIYEKEPVYRKMWEAWLKAERKRSPEAFKDVTTQFPKDLFNDADPQARAFLKFLVAVERRHTRRMRGLLRSWGSKAMVSSLCGWVNPMCYALVRSDYDYVDNHFYLDLPDTWNNPPGSEVSCWNRNVLKESHVGVQETPFRAVWGKPLTVSEFNNSWPGRYRAYGALMNGTMASLQGWDAMWKFAWSHDREGHVNGCLPCAYFDVSRDPTSIAADRATMCEFRRGDVLELTKSVALVAPARFLLGTVSGGEPPWRFAAWYAKYGTFVGNEDAVKATWKVLYPDSQRMGPEEFARRVFGWEDGGARLPPAGDGQVRLDRERGSFVLDTPKTSGGFVESGRFDAGFVAADVGEVPTTLWASSLDDRPLASSKRILLTHLTEVQNSGSVIEDGERGRVLYARGSLPHRVRRAVAEVALRLDRPGVCTVYALSFAGERLARLPATVKDGALVFTADIARDPASATVYYEIVSGVAPGGAL